MKIELKEITVKELFEGYKDNQDSGVVAYGGRLDVRPPYQREFIYKEAQRNAVIDTVRRGFPLNVMYWAVREDGTYEIIDGQQRTISICQYLQSDFSVKINGEVRYWSNLRDEEKKPIEDYKLMVYFCSGTDTEKLEWFKTINIAGEELTNQELRNAVYSGPWVTDAKRYFSKKGCAAFQLSSKYVAGSPIRQELLETAIKWASDNHTEDYMARHQHDANAEELWAYFQKVIAWVRKTFTNPRKEMKGVDWGPLYSQYHENPQDAAAIETEIARLMADSDVTDKKGIYPYILDHEERHLSIRTFDDNTKREVFERQQGKCPRCGKQFPIEEMEADHITPWSQGGRTIAANCQMLCRKCNREKSDK